MVRFLERSEYEKTRPLSLQCFGNEDGFLDDYYADEGLISHGRIAVYEEDSRILSMVHVVPMLMTAKEQTVCASYLLCVATDPDFRHRGYMDHIFAMLLPVLKDEGDAYAFLCPVNTAIYRHLGFTYDWVFDPVYTDLLLADDGLTVCSTKLLNAADFTPPEQMRVRLKGSSSM